MTPFIKKNEVKKDWYIINAENIAVGRSAQYVLNIYLDIKKLVTLHYHLKQLSVY